MVATCRSLRSQLSACHNLLYTEYAVCLHAMQLRCHFDKYGVGALAVALFLNWKRQTARQAFSSNLEDMSF